MVVTKRKKDIWDIEIPSNGNEGSVLDSYLRVNSSILANICEILKCLENTRLNNQFWLLMNGFEFLLFGESKMGVWYHKDHLE